MKRTRPSIYVLAWLLAAAGAAYLFHQWYFASNYLGLMETRRHALGFRETGNVAELFVQIGDRVTFGQPLAALDRDDLERQKAILEKALREFNEGLPADERRNALEFQRLRLALEADLSNMAETKALFASRRAELKSVLQQIEKLQSAENSGLGHSPELTRLLLRRDWLERYVSEANSAEKDIKRKVRARTKSDITQPDDEATLVSSALSERALDAGDLRARIALLDERIRTRSIVSPCTGSIVEILAWKGDTLPAFSPCIVIEETRSDYLQMYIPETTDTQIEAGTRVEVTPRRHSMNSYGGTVVFVHPGFEAVPERLAFRNQIFWARKVRVLLDEGHPFLPGEAVHVRFSSENGVLPGSAHAAPSPPKSEIENQEMGDIRVPPELARRSRFEPSAIAWLEDIRRFVVLSDDTGWKNANDKAPWIFLMDRAGKVEKEPLVVQGAEKFNDLEALAVENPQKMWFVSSQNCSKKGKRKTSREKLFQIRREGRKFEVVRGIALLSAIEASYSRDDMKRLGLTDLDRDGRALLNIEGATWRDGSLYLGLKQPLKENKAIVWKLERPEALLATGKLVPGQLSVYAEFSLGDHPAGSISSLEFDTSGTLYGLSTVAGAGVERQVGRYFRLTPKNLEKAEILATFPGKKAEGLAFFEGKAFVVFDADQGTPSFALIPKDAPR